MAASTGSVAVALPPTCGDTTEPLLGPTSYPATVPPTRNAVPLPKGHLDVDAALRSGWRLFRKNPFSYMLWALCYNIFINFIPTIWPDHEEMPDLPKTLGSAVIYVVIILICFRLPFGPFIAASNCLRQGGQGFTWRALFRTSYSFYLPLLAIFILQLIACVVVSTAIVGPIAVLLSAFFFPQLVTIVSALAGVAANAYILMSFNFASGLVIEYHEVVSIFKSLVISIQATHTVFCSMVFLSLASVGIVILGYTCLFVGSLLALPVVFLAWADAFDQVIGMNPDYSGDPHTCVGCS